MRPPLELVDRNKALILPGFVLVAVGVSSPLRQLFHFACLPTGDIRLFHFGCFHNDDIVIAIAAGIVCIVGIAAAKQPDRHLRPRTAHGIEGAGA